MQIKKKKPFLFFKLVNKPVFVLLKIIQNTRIVFKFQSSCAISKSTIFYFSGE